MLNLTNTNFKDEVEKYKGVAVVDFWASWCGPCQSMALIVEEVASETKEKAKVAKVNVDDSPELSSKFGIMSIPTFVFFKDGKEVERKIGMQSKEGLINILEGLSKG